MIVAASFLAWLLPSLPSLPKPPAVETEVIGHPAERHLPDGEPLQEWVMDPALVSEQRGDRLEIQQVEGQEVETIKLRDVIPAIRFASGIASRSAIRASTSAGPFRSFIAALRFLTYAA